MKSLILLAAGSATSIAAAAEAKPNPLKIELISEVSQFTPGEIFHVGLHLKHPDGFHSYWKHPGTVGVPTTVKWTLPEGFSAGEIQWPSPEKVMMAVYAAQGYHGDPLLIIPITPPDSLPPETTSVTLEAKVSWMCCGKACSPANDVPFSLEIPAATASAIDPETRPLFEKSRADSPVADPAWTSTATREGTTITLTLKPAQKLENLQPENLRFFTSDGQVDSDAKQTITILPDGTLRFEMTAWEFAPKNPPSLPGVVRATSETPFSIAVDPAY